VVAEKTTKNATGLLYFGTPCILYNTVFCSSCYLLI